MTHQDDSDIQVDEPVADDLKAIGETLRAARHASGMSVKEIASDLHLGEDIIIALEDADQSRLPNQVFVHGYIKKYAKILDLDDLDIKLEALTSPESEATVLSQPRALQLKSNRSNFPIGMILTILAIVLTIVFIFILWNQGITLLGHHQLSNPKDNSHQTGIAHHEQIPVMDQIQIFSQIKPKPAQLSIEKSPQIPVVVKKRTQAKTISSDLDVLGNLNNRLKTG